MMSWGCGRLPTAKDERGLSTLEWILLVAAVGGLAAVGVLVVRNATDATSEQVDGETDQVLAADLDQADADMTKIMLSYTSRKGPRPLRNNVDDEEIRECHIHAWSHIDKQFNAEGDFVGRSDPSAVLTILDKWGDIFYFAPVVVDRDTGTTIPRKEGYCGAYPLISS